MKQYKIPACSYLLVMVPRLLLIMRAMFFSFLQDGVEREYYAVFDGHGGVDAATYTSTHLHVALSRQETLKSDTGMAFKNAFIQTDEMFRIKARREVWASGGEFKD